MNAAGGVVDRKGLQVDATEPFTILWTMEHGNTTCTTKELRAFMLQTGGRIMVRGHMREVTTKRLAPGVYRVEKAPLK